ncbi:MAG: cold shock domain-containing protein [Phycisphaerae bacterium]
MPVGTVKWFDCKKGFGFIVGPEQQDIFVHYTIILGDGFRRLRDGEEVEYELTNGRKGLAASWVKRLNPPAERAGADESSPAAADDPARGGEQTE